MGKTSLRMVLRNFLDHYEKLEDSLQRSRKAVKEMAESGRSTPPPLSLYAQEFLKLKELTESLKNDANCPMIEGRSHVNKKKNRYKDILPYDNSRVILSEYPGVPGSDYINANYVRGSSGNQKAYIASQGPLHNTVNDFWRMIWETEVLVIVMACNESEAGNYKCETYWPNNSDEKQYGNITVEHVKWRQVCPDFLVRTFKVSSDNEERTICQFHYTTWPDHGVPSSVQPILELVRLMRDVQSSESRPILVHCSAGCGRTGTICSIDYVWGLLRTGKLQENFSLFDIISDMRRQRVAMVQTVEQYMLCYKAVATLFEQHLKLIDSHTYENVDDDGEPLGIENSVTQDDQSLSSSSESIENLISANLNDLKKTSENNDSDQESSDSNSEEPMDQPVELCKEVRPLEKLIGKATVIRRPSIAKLKAIFDNPENGNDDIPQPSTSSNARITRLQRSQSIKENFRNFNFNFHLEINQPKLPSRKTKSYTLSAAKLNVYKKNVAFSNLVTNQERNVGRTRVMDIFDQPTENNASTKNSSNLRESSDKLNSDIPLINPNEIKFRPVISMPRNISDMPNNSVIQPLACHRPRPPSLNESSRSAPPKPPRTYQHVVDDSCIVKTSEGRLIVTVAQPRQHQGNLAESQNNSDCNYDQTESIYEQLGARKFSYQSSPNLTNLNNQNGRIAFISSSSGGAPSFYIPPQQAPPQPPIKPMNFCDNFTNASNAIYSNPLIPKSFALPMFPAVNQPSAQNNIQVPIRPSNEYPAFENFASYIDVLNSQHFQQHQAKPIMLHHGYFEPIYGAANHQFINQRPPGSSFPMISHAPPTRSKSIPNRLTTNLHPAAIHESLYGNREICFNNTRPFNESMSLNGPSATKENIYSEIQIESQKNATAVNSDDDSDKNRSNNEASNNANIKNNRFKKFRRAFKMFRFKVTSQSVSKTNPNSVGPSHHKTNSMSANTNRSVMNETPVAISLKVPNNVPINPLNGQPLNRPPHSHRFQNTTTQWTQV